MPEYRFKPALKYPHLNVVQFKDVPNADAPLRALGGGKYALQGTWMFLGWGLTDRQGTSNHRLLFQDRLTSDKRFCYAEASNYAFRIPIEKETYVSNVPPNQT